MELPTVCAARLVANGLARYHFKTWPESSLSTLPSQRPGTRAGQAIHPLRIMTRHEIISDWYLRLSEEGWLPGTGFDAYP